MEFRFVNLSNGCYAKKNCERQLNDILEVNEEDGTYYRICLNNSGHYVELPADSKMLKVLKDKTWTLDNKAKYSKLVKSNSEVDFTIYLSDVLEQFGYERLDYEVIPDVPRTSKISTKEYQQKREEYRKQLKQ